MLYVPSAIAAADLDIAQSPYFGGEFGVYMTNVPAVLIGTIDFTAPAAALYTDNAATSMPAATDLQLVATTPVISAANVVVTFACLDNTGTPIAMNGVATFAPPSRAANQSSNFGRGIATDLVPAVPGKKYTAITSLTSVTAGSANMQLALYQLPVQADYTFIGCTTEIDFNTKSRMAKGVDCGMESDAFVKRGKTQPGELSISSKLKGFMDGMARFDGAKATCMLVGLKDGQDTCDRLVFTQYVQTVKPKLPEGDGEATLAGTGKFVEHLFFVAP